ncbi:DNA polymerase II large subunit [Haladaptatus litoreus]|uniref:DNA polymerase II large subunit n=1 Tax=Haladaptatus litoreus TaxID=553468 RepID=A0A1N7BSE7_9EURY|nr:DNA-directed DNA polymerase II large subunit [Haladaptatus litoreus]SIR54248.1 DNA polymerase II large subunit [Haladaptatus litoreus]
MREEDRQYFERLESQLDEAFDVAETARENSGDPQPEVEIPVAKDMADRVENILGIEGVAERVRELEGQMSREEAALELAEDFAEGNVGDYDTRDGKVEGAVRTAVALLTEGVVAAPIEGIDRVEILTNDDGTEFVNVYYAGPIRSAGGTAQALSVLVADYTRALIGLDEFKARDDEIERYAEEINLYDSETGLQYSPKDKESKFIAENIPVMLDGEATGDEEVSGFRDLERVDTNSARGGMCLVLAEGIALKAPKIQRYTRNLDEIDWPWLQDLIDGTIGKDDENEESAAQADDSEGEDETETADEEAETDEPDGPLRVEPATKFLRDLIAGRPVFTHPSEAGGFRLRYGRARNHGFATAGVHPATMHLVDDFLATGTQIKTERPGKAAGVIPVDTIEGPTVRLANGDVRRIDDIEEAVEVRNGVKRILDLGEYLVNYGEFVENNHPLAPASYTFEWWVQDFEHSGADVQAMRDNPHIDLENPSVEEALDWAIEYDAPLHPSCTHLWHDISVGEFDLLAEAVEAGEIRDGRLHLENTDDVRIALEHLLVQHWQGEEIEISEWKPFVRSLGFDDDLNRDWDGIDDLSRKAREWGKDGDGNGDGDDAEVAGGTNAIEAVNEVAPFTVRERAPTRIGNRMGRPEKSEKRELSPAVHTLFPLGEAGGDQRDVAKAAKHTEGMSGVRGQAELRIGRRECEDCGNLTFKCKCPDCGGNTYPDYECPDCGTTVEPDQSGRAECPRCEILATSVEPQTVNLNDEYRGALESVGERENVFDTLKGVKGLTSAHKTPEPIEKGILRAKHGVSAFKDGTIRYDMTDLPVTAVRPNELDVSADQLRALGYDEDIHGEPFRHDDQLVELRVQDIVLSDGAAEHLLKTADFVDNLLTDYYGLDPFYEMDEREELVGELVFGMAPHTSAAVVGRIIGFTSAAVGYAHPYFHAAKRRNCFHPETKVWYRDEDEKWRYDEIQRLVEERLKNPKEDDFGALVEELDCEVLVPSIDENGNVVRKPIEAVSRHPAPEHLVEIETRSGREITVTPDHSMLQWHDDSLEEIEARELEVGMSVPGFSRKPGTDCLKVEVSSGVVADGGSFERDEITRVEIVQSEISHTYCVTVSDTHTLVANDLYVGQCDGDEDCVMLLMDGLLNFSKEFLPDKRGGQMDAPLVMSSRIDPSEIDDEAHNMDIVEQYSREFYEATLEMADPEDVDITIAEDYLGTDEEYTNFRHTHDTSNIALGPDLSAYKTLGSMMDKMNAQLELARKTRAVDQTDVAERVIEGHFLPDLIGNLRAFSRQETRCLDCGVKYRRMPLSGDCRECGGRVNLTVHQGSVNKYMDTAIQVADEYDCREYTKQRLQILDRSLESVFENDKNKQSGIADFM